MTRAANLIAQEGILAHEAAGHLRYTDFAPWHRLAGTVKSGKDDHLIHHFVNIIEDARINHLLAQDFPGSGKKLAFVEAWAMQKHKDRFDEEGVTNASNAAIVALMTEIIAKTPHFIDDDSVRAFMDEARPLFHACVSQTDTKGRHPTGPPTHQDIPRALSGGRVRRTVRPVRRRRGLPR